MGLSIIIAFLFIGLPLAAIIALLMDKRPGAETATWALAIVAAPFLGAAVYLIWRIVEKRQSSRPTADIG
ncbi:MULTISPECIES: PLDc N-terminal domain-containing protein [unclassified Corynebacterium]|uniref:PLDc N-terminal domain-containing protein n=1 Tax=unclassified Corynebacterium TaxID=2624378 RepID=UPI0029CA4E86|nr:MULTISPECIES: PLDc N-terminal domain-containing protein [unclassified Corynebacterium]WPF65697.1 PLDc N-terminal domain-containing protein [Corynebacterium sp. 22KM0430]WPF68193.1 PLDc N-terminal domain-containing protein [Corynebacterium sp. 21KM1197]